MDIQENKKEKPTEHLLVKPSIHKRLKDLSYEREEPITQLVEEALLEMFKHYGVE